MQLSFADRTYLVTGGGSGIGKGVAAGLAAAGANVMIMGRNADRLSSAADQINATSEGRRVRYEPADVTNEEEVTNVVEAVTAWNGRLNGPVAIILSGRNVDMDLHKRVLDGVADPLAEDRM